jgi:uncharacterized protein with PQ loop repeat
MNSHSIQLLAGVTSSIIFMVSNFPMVIKALRTKDLSSYSLGNLALRNIGNVAYWPYVISMPMGPVWFLQAFYTLVGLLMLFFYLHYEMNWLHI